MENTPAVSSRDSGNRLGRQSRYVRPLGHTAGVTFTTRMLTPETWDDFAALVQVNNGVWVAAGALDSTRRAWAMGAKETGS